MAVLLCLLDCVYDLAILSYLDEALRQNYCYEGIARNVESSRQNVLDLFLKAVNCHSVINAFHLEIFGEIFG